MTPRIETISEKKLVGKKITMSLAQNRTAELWKSFMPKRKEITNRLTNDLISLQVYPPDYFTAFKPENEFEKWALTEVSNFDFVPHEMNSFLIPGGMYAIFHYKGLNTDTSIFQYIYSTWLPNSDYVLDNRPHFEVLGEKYKNGDPDSEEDIWIPVKLK
jgi:AraC family transcriptional regulator